MSLEENLSEKVGEKKNFRRIESKFRQYWKYLFSLIAIYIVCYVLWIIFISPKVRNSLQGKDGKAWWMILSIAIFQGLLFTLDGFVTSLLKSPFNQMCYAVNLSKTINYKEKDLIITQATRSNEQLKETLKKFGILTISAELVRVFVEKASAGDVRLGKYWYLINISFLIPLAFSAFDVFLIHKRLRKLKDSMEIQKTGKEV